MTCNARLPFLLLAAGLAACAVPLTRRAPFRERPDSVEPGDLRGPFDGRVVDAGTGRPVAGALVQATWTFVQGTGFTAPAGYREIVVSTDATGRYQVPRLKDLPAGRRLADFGLIIYKKGYVAYRSDRRFDDFGTRTAFAQRANEVKLDRWRSDLSHVRHLRYVGGSPALAALTSWELPEAAAELEGRRPVVAAATQPAATEPSTLPAAPRIAAADLLGPDDVKKTTGFAGSFDVAPLADQPTSAEYDSVHLRAHGLPETHDVALRIWFLDPGAAQKQYGALLDELPNVQERNEIGDRSFRALSDAHDILAIGFLEGRRANVVLLTCGAAQCHTHDTVLVLARLVKDRIDKAEEEQ